MILTSTNILEEERYCSDSILSNYLSYGDTIFFDYTPYYEYSDIDCEYHINGARCYQDIEADNGHEIVLSNFENFREPFCTYGTVLDIIDNDTGIYVVYSTDAQIFVTYSNDTDIFIWQPTFIYLFQHLKCIPNSSCYEILTNISDSIGSCSDDLDINEIIRKSIDLEDDGHYEIELYFTILKEIMILEDIKYPSSNAHGRSLILDAYYDFAIKKLPLNSWFDKYNLTPPKSLDYYCSVDKFVLMKKITKH